MGMHFSPSVLTHRFMTRDKPADAPFLSLIVQSHLHEEQSTMIVINVYNAPPLPLTVRG